MPDTSKIVFDSRIPTDKLLGSYDSFLVSSNSTPNSTVTTTSVHVTNIPETTFVVGIFSIDNGATWQGMEAEVDHSDNQGAITVYAQSIAGQVEIVAKNRRDFGAPAGAFVFTVLYKVMLLAKSDTSNVTPQPIGSNVYFDSRKNYQKIALDDYQTVTGSNTTTVFTHGLGYEPRVRVFYETGGVLRIRGGITTSRTDITPTTVSVFMNGSITNTKIYVRVYYDA
jgi:hypothetical protein